VPHSPPSPSPHLPGTVDALIGTLFLNEAYTGAAVHVDSELGRRELVHELASTLRAFGANVLDVHVEPQHRDPNGLRAVLWKVEIFSPEANYAALQVAVAHPYFLSVFNHKLSELGNDHANSVLTIQRGLIASATTVRVSAPAPPPTR
jgi:hypothetical protein